MLSRLAEYLEDIKEFEFHHQCIQTEKIFVHENFPVMSSRKLESLKNIARLQRYYQCNPVRFVNDFFNIEPFDAQAWVLQQSWTCPNVCVVATRGFGKALALDTRIPTPYGDKTIADIGVGDTIFGDDGSPVKVIATSPIFYKPCYEIEFSDGEKIVCSEDHLWTVNSRSHKKKNPITVDTKWVSEHYTPKKKRQPVPGTKFDRQYNESNLSVNLSQPLQYEKKILPIDPYVLGLWLGDGCQTGGFITESKWEYEEYCKLIESRGYSIHSITDDSNGHKKITIHMPNGTPLRTILRELKETEEKHIPVDYLYSSIEDRLNLLRGLCDSDGSITKGAPGVEFCQNNVQHRKLCEGFHHLLVSLGIKYSSSVYERKYVYKGESRSSTAERFYFPASKSMAPFSLPRKYALLRDSLHVTCKRKYITNVKPVEVVATKCLMVDNESHLFVCGEKNTITHNSTIIDLLLMAKGMLFCNYWSYIASGSGPQAQQTFTTLERLANDNIDTMVGSTGKIFKDELIVPNANGDGFSHSVDGFKYTLNNFSSTLTLNSNVDSKRGERPVMTMFHGLPHYSVMSRLNESAEEIGKAGMLIRVEGYV